MLLTKARPELQSHLAKLTEWTTGVPRRARRFHTARNNLDAQIRAVFNSVLPWRRINDQEVTRFRDRMNLLEEIAGLLGPLMRDAILLESEVNGLGDFPIESDLQTWVHDRSRDWILRLEQIGTTCETMTDVARDRKDLVKITSEVRQIDRALRLLGEAERVIPLCAKDLGAGALRGLLPDYRRRLRAENTTLDMIDEWIRQLGELVMPLTELANRLQDPPPEIQDVATILTETRAWSSALGGYKEDDIAQLEERRFEPLDWSRPLIDNLLADARSLCTQLIAEAQRLRGERQQALEEEMSDLRQAARRSDLTELETQMSALRSTPTNRSQVFRDWLAQHDRFRASFNAIVYSHIGALDEQLTEASARLRRRLDELKKRPLSDDVSRQIVLQERAVRELPTSEHEEILGRLRGANALAREIERLEQQAEHEYHALHELQRQLATRSAAIEEQARRVRRVKIEIGDLPLRIAALSQTEVAGSLAERQQLAAAHAAELDALETAFIERCRAELAVQLSRVQETLNVLHAAGDTASAIEVPSIAEQSTPAAATEAVIKAARLAHSSKLKASSQLALMETLAKERQQRFTALSLEELPPTDRQQAKRLMVELRERIEHQQQNVLRRLAGLARVVHECNMFFDQLLQEETRARKRVADLKEGLRLLHAEQLDRYCPELTDRVSALIYGIPTETRQWSGIRHQLDEAESLLGRVDVHARRLAADALGRAVDTLQKSVRAGGTNPGTRNSAEALLRQLREYGTESLPPVSLRARVIETANDMEVRRVN